MLPPALAKFTKLSTLKNSGRHSITSRSRIEIRLFTGKSMLRRAAQDIASGIAEAAAGAHEGGGVEIFIQSRLHGTGKLRRSSRRAGSETGSAPDRRHPPGGEPAGCSGRIGKPGNAGMKSPVVFCDK